jgi:hypothetical protein
MSRKSLKKKNSKILRLKILLEDKEVAEEELNIGSRELTQILKEYSAGVTASQKKKFDNLFFGATTGASLFWDASADDLILDGACWSSCTRR